MTPILACIDASDYAERVCDYGAWAAARLNAPVDILHVIDHPGDVKGHADLSGNLGWGGSESLLEEITAVDAQRNALAMRRGEALLERARRRFESSGISDVRTTQRHGTLVDEVVSRDEQSRLIVIGQRGERMAQATHHLGSNLERVIRSTTSSVLVVPPTQRDIQTFTIAYDGSPSAHEAVQAIARTELLVGARCQILTVGSNTQKARELVQPVADLLSASGYETEVFIVDGDADAVIIETVGRHDSDLLVMGAYGHSRMRRLIIGSTTTAILRAASIPVLVFRRESGTMTS